MKPMDIPDFLGAKMTDPNHPTGRGMNLFDRPGTFGGMDVRIVDAQKQQRTTRDVRGPWVRPKVPSKRVGRWGTRRMWKRRNAPHYVMLYREPTDVLVLAGSTIIATPLQWDAIRRQTSPLSRAPHPN